MSDFFLFFPTAAGLISAGFALFLTGCGPRQTPVDDGIASQTLLMGNAAEPGSLDPHLASILSDQIIVNALFEGLTLLDERTGNALPAAAETWTASADGLVWTFRLRADLKWSNGDPLTAQNFVDSWKRELAPALAADNAGYLYAIKNAEAFNGGKSTGELGLAAPDPRTIVITLEHPTPYLPALVSLPAWFPVNLASMKPFTATDIRDSRWTRPGNLVSNGPFTLTEWTPNARVILSKNPLHRDAASTQLRRLIFFPIENPEVEERDFRAGQLHVTFNLPVSKIAGWRERNPEQLRIDPTLQANFLRFNTTRAPLTDPRVRRALALGIDREVLARTVLQGSRLPAHSITPPGTGGYTARAGVSLDLTTARQLLADAGFPEGKGLPVIDLQCRNDEIMPRLAEAMQAMWQRDLGVHVTVSQVEQKSWIQNQKTLNYGISTAAWTADFPDPVTFLGLFTADSAYNWTGWKNPEYDKLLNDAAETADPAQRLEIFQAAEALLLKDSPVTPIHFGAQTYLINPAVHGWDPAPLVFRRFQIVRLEP